MFKSPDSCHKYSPYSFQFVPGFDSNVPVDSMQGLDLGSQQGSNFGHMDQLPHLGPTGNDLNVENLDNMPPPPQNNQMAAWFDTDL